MERYNKNEKKFMEVIANKAQAANALFQLLISEHFF
jgi:hypothetical protein